MTLFPIMIEVEESAVGPVLRILNKTPGVAHFHLNLDKVRAARGHKTLKKTNGTTRPPPQDHDDGRPKPRQIIIAELLSGPKNLDHLRKKLNERGHDENSLSNFLYALKQAGLTESAGTGLHKLSERALAELKAHQTAAAQDVPQPAVGALPAPATSRGAVRQIILDIITKATEPVARPTLVNAGTEAGGTERAVGAALSRLKAKKIIRSAGLGFYELAPKREKSKANPGA